MSKRLFDILFSLAASILALPMLACACLLIWSEDGHWPLYSSLRVGRFGRDFRIFKLRTMVPDGERSGGISTATSDQRLTRLGSILRRYKIDELPQFWNVLLADMSIVGPRPNFSIAVDRYTASERQLLAVRPGITDIASIVFLDEGEILNGSVDPDVLYEAVIRPWKNRLGLLYVEHRSMALDLALISLTAVTLVSRRFALKGVDAILRRLDVSAQLRQICARTSSPPAGQPPGQIV